MGPEVRGHIAGPANKKPRKACYVILTCNVQRCQVRYRENYIEEDKPLVVTRYKDPYLPLPEQSGNSAETAEQSGNPIETAEQPEGAAQQRLLKLAVVADLHGRPSPELYEALKTEKPDAILIPGDLTTIGCEQSCGGQPQRSDNPEKLRKAENATLEFLKTAVRIAPVYYSRGNHEWGIDDAYRNAVKATGTVLLENEWVKFGNVFIGGQNSASCDAYSHRRCGKHILPDTDWLKNSPGGGYKILLCHHPEYYNLVAPYADLIISGHAHGGQWRMFGRGVFAPGQGLFPKYSRGMYENKMIVSAGLTNTTWVPRINNSTELVIVEIYATAVDPLKN